MGPFPITPENSHCLLIDYLGKREISKVNETGQISQSIMVPEGI